MYKKITLLCTMFGTLMQNASDLRPWLEIKPSYFYFSSDPIKQIYSKGGFEIQGSASIPIGKHLDLYGSLGYRKANGHALNTGEKTKLMVIPIDFGLRPIFKLSDQIAYFLSFGPRFFYLHQHNYSPYVNQHIKGGNCGLFVNTGFNLLLANSFLLGIFGEYSYEKKTVKPTMLNVFSNGSIKIGGWAIGASIGCSF